MPEFESSCYLWEVPVPAISAEAGQGAGHCWQIIFEKGQKVRVIGSVISGHEI